MANDVVINVKTNDQASAAFQRIAQSAQQMAGILNGAFNQATQAINKLMTDAVKFNDGLTDQNQSLVDYKNAMTELDTATQELRAEFAEALAPALTEIAGILTDTVIPFVRQLIDFFNQLPEPVRNGAIAIGLFSIGLVGVVGKILSLVAMAGQVATFLTALGPAFSGVGAAASAAASGMGAFAASAFAAALPILALAAAVALLVIVWQKFGAQATQSAQMLGQIVQIEFGRMAQSVSDWANSMIDEAARMLGAFLDFANQFSNVGQAIIQGIWAGIQSGWNWLVSQVQALAQSLINAAMSALDAASPSKAFAKVGLTIPQGLAVGITSGMPQVRGALTGSLGALPGSVSAGGRMGGGSITIVNAPAISLERQYQAQTVLVDQVLEAQRRVDRNRR